MPHVSHDRLTTQTTDAGSAPRASLEQRRRERFARVEPRGARVHTARERAELLLDEGTFVELAPLKSAQPGAGSGVVTGWGLVDGRPVVVACHDAAIASGAIGAVMAAAICRAQRFAIDSGFPIVYVNDSGGARVPDGIHALHGCGEIFALNVEAQARIPQISVILGPCAGAAAYSPALTDWTIMVKGHGHMFLTGPDIVRAATGEDATADEIGGSGMHTRISGVAHLEVETELDALQSVRHLLSYLPSNVEAPLPVGDAVPVNPISAAGLPTVVPEKASVVFDMRNVVDGVLDNGARLELMPEHAGSALTLFGRIDGRPVGVVANQPAVRGGILDSKTSVKIARFVEFCGRFGIPIVTLVDVPGFLPGTVEEGRGIITHGAKVLKAYVEAKRSMRLTVVVRKAYGGAYIAMGSTSLGADHAWAWSNAEIAVMGPGGAVGLLHRRALAAAEDPAALRDELAAEYRENVARPYAAAEAGIIEDVIHPEETRDRLVAAMRLLEHR
ncbi:acyl-CoA carboxylase subunit beta [Aeromicrobium senzhongii]|uniref:Acyl-CoA carboxylase subunit beta n=1 Tax=Aeromicrobium senzhongii TaxID=2663859 RepID=A0ABX6SR64_9ACTN|nr:carboxyl transferase domain-containing protein [Aeromicrobium senzhongii]MTB88838.1 acyl-CoA carboxylase subunit beta [Aeromicrobium senzhongii]QNL93874.1 acyl-CoA carboxylase subunit beta [Aeromicrobium senzhongii]